MKLPKLYAPVRIKFWSLRNQIGLNLGMIFDCDTEVERVAIRVLCPEGWKWQIRQYYAICEWDDLAEVDQEIMNEYGSELEYELV